MQNRFREELAEFKNRLLSMSFAADTAVQKACESLFSGDKVLAHEVIREEEKINRLEIEIDEQGHSLLALHAPVAVDLRFLTMVLKINTDLERVGDHAVNIAEKTLELESEVPEEVIETLKKMTTAVQSMLHQALESFLKEKADWAQGVLKRDDEVDEYNDRLYEVLCSRMENRKLKIKTGAHLMMISHNLERVADLANNIAEDVIYFIQGKEIRHHLEE